MASWIRWECANSLLVLLKTRGKNLHPLIKKEKRRGKKRRPGDRVSHRNTGDKLLVTAWVGRESTALEQNGGSKHESYYLNYTRL